MKGLHILSRRQVKTFRTLLTATASIAAYLQVKLKYESVHDILVLIAFSSKVDSGSVSMVEIQNFQKPKL